MKDFCPTEASLTNCLQLNEEVAQDLEHNGVHSSGEHKHSYSQVSAQARMTCRGGHAEGIWDGTAWY